MINSAGPLFGEHRLQPRPSGDEFEMPAFDPGCVKTLRLA
jgi:hypothetical protein